MNRSGMKHSRASIEELAAGEHSKTQVEKIIQFIGDDQSRFYDLASIFLGKDATLAPRASWPLSYIILEHPKLLKKWLGKIIKNLNKPSQHPAMYRNTFRFLEEIEIPDTHAAQVLDFAYKFANDSIHPPAVRAFAITTAWNVVRKFPDMKNELLQRIQYLQNHESPAIRSRCRQISTQLNRNQAIKRSSRPIS